MAGEHQRTAGFCGLSAKLTHCKVWGPCAGGHGGHGHDVTYQGLSLHPASATHRNLAKGFGGLMWFWIFYRFYNDYDTFLVSSHCNALRLLLYGS